MGDVKVAAIFPGQGSQSVGMGAEYAGTFPVVRDTFAEANDILGFDLTAICFHGPAEELKRTSIAQPALVMMSTACWRLLAATGFSCAIVAGHSLGEYSALVAAGALNYADALRLVRCRGELMEETAAAHPGAMAAVLGMDDADVEALCLQVSSDTGIVTPANYNSPGQIVVSGESAAVAALRTAVKAQGGRSIPLPVSGAFHSPLMESAAQAFRAVLDTVAIAVPMMPVVQNVTAAATTDPIAIRDALSRQITGSVQWVRSLNAIRESGITRFVEVGPGNVLTGLVQRTLPDVEAQSFAEAITGRG